MKNTLTAVVVVAIIGMGAANAAPGLLGLGVMAGEPTGFSAKLWLGNRVALDAAVAYSYLWHGTGVHMHGDVLFHTRSLLPSILGFMPLYAGVGARVRLANGVNNPMLAGIRIPFGAEYVLPLVRIGAFIELAPIIDLTPTTGFYGNGAVGVRYYFG